MRLRSLLTLTLAAAAAAACSGGVAVQPQSNLAPEAAPQAAASPVGYFYAVNYNSSDISQYALTPAGKTLLTPLGQNYALPAGCTNPISIAVIAKKNLAYVTCFSGELLPLTLGAKHELEPSTVKPVPVPSPLVVIAPRTGAPGYLYVDTYGGAVDLFSYSAAGLKLQKSYNGGSIYLDAMSLYTSPGGKSTLFVAAPYANYPCGSSTSGAILRYTQATNGTLVPQTTLPACTYAFVLAVVNDRLFWAGANHLGGYSISQAKPIPMPTTFAAGGGPGYYPAAFKAIVADPTPKPLGPATESTGEFSVAGGNGNLYFFKGGKLIARLGATSIISADCHYVSKFVVNGTTYEEICWVIRGDQVYFYARTARTTAFDVLYKDPLGNLPAAEIYAPASEFGK